MLPTLALEKAQGWGTRLLRKDNRANSRFPIDRLPLGRWCVSIHAENELDAFLAGLPAYQRKYLEQGISSLTREDTHQLNEWFRESEIWLSAPNPDEKLIAGSLPVIAETYRLLLAQAPLKLKERRKREEREIRGVIRSFIEIAVGNIKRGRKPRDELAEQIWALDAEDKTNQEIRETLSASGEHLSLEGVESYLKTRRRPRKQ
ncbi:MAG: hypothetical protein ABSF23_03840 [Terracidiphilus sp.]|jgi:hypothetical protein